jgi:hypothetical protein
MCANPVDRNNLVRIMNKQLTMINVAQTLSVPMIAQRFFSQIVEIFSERSLLLNSIDRNCDRFYRVRQESPYRLLRFISPGQIWTI